MEQRSSCLFPALNGLSARAIHNELITFLGPDPMAYWIVTKYLRQR
jgi:hypothetical protein